MGKGGRTKNKSKRSILPRGIPQKRTQAAKHSNNKTVVSPFEYARTTNSSSRVKHHVHNKQVSGSSSSAVSSSKQQQHTSALAKSIERRKSLLKSKLAQQHKSNTFIDRRIGEATAGGNSHQLSVEEDYNGLKQRRENAMLKRIVAERVRRSKRVDKFRLEDDDGDDGFGLTHRVSTFISVDISTCVYNHICHPTYVLHNIIH